MKIPVKPHILTICLLVATVSLHFLVPFDIARSKTLDTEGYPNFVTFQKNVYITKTIGRLSLKQKIGQLLFISIPATNTQDSLNTILTQYSPGGILLFSSNIQSKEQTRELTSTLNNITEENGLPPTFIAADEEGGVVERIWFDPVPYSAPELGNTNSESATRATAQHTAVVLQELGINTVFAPVVDVAFSPDSMMANRSFGSTPDIVSQQASWTIDEFNNNQIFSTAKHFPGHGRTAVDSHEELPTVNITKETWLESDALPFISAIENDVPFIMTGHLLYPLVDDQVTSISSTWINDILRGELGFNGIVVSDDIKMGALGPNIPQTAVEALSAGSDMIIAAVDLDTIPLILQKLTNYYDKDENTDELMEKLHVILGVKYELVVDTETAYGLL